MTYLWVKHLHVTFVALAFMHFLLRGFLDWRGIAWRNRRLWRVLPHTNDSLLFFSGLTLAWLSGQYPFVQQWLTLKLLLLIAYIILGSLALRISLPTRKRVFSGLLAVTTILLMVLIARYKPYLPIT